MRRAEDEPSQLQRGAADAEREQLLKYVARVTTDAIWDWNLDNGSVWWNEGMQTLFGFEPPEVEPDASSWINRIHPDDAERVVGGIHEVIEGTGEQWSDEYRFRRRDGSYAYVVDRGFVIRDAAGRGVRMIGGMSDHSERHRVFARLHSSEAQYRLLFEHNPQPMWVYDPTTLRFLAVNRVAVEHYGYSEAEFLAMPVRQVWMDEDVPMMREIVGAVTPGTRHYGIRRRHRRKDGSVIEVEISAEGIVFDGRPARLVLCSDITDRVRAERELQRLSRAQRMLSACNETLIRAVDEQDLLNEVCRIAVDIGGYRMAWIGMAHEDAEHSIEAVAHAGANADYMKDIRVSWDADGPHGQGPAARCVRRAEVVIVPDVLQDRSFAPWAEELVASGFRSIVSLPLRNKVQENAFGLLYLYASDVASVGADEISLLSEMADDLAFGIHHLRAQREQQRVQQAVVKVAAAVSSRTGTEFFEQLARNMAEALGAKAGFVARLLPGTDARARTMAAVINGKLRKNFEYSLYGTPCQNLLLAEHYVLARDAAKCFPQALGMSTLGVQAYAGCRLDAADGQPLGQLFVMFSEPLAHTEFLVSTLQIFAARAASEIERQESETAIQKLAFYDPLTGLPNRLLLTDRLQQALANAQRNATGGALLFIDLDNFKTLNDTLGHDQGDLLLEQVATRLLACVRDADTVARLGGDEFVVMLESLGAEIEEIAAHARGIGEKVLAALGAPYRLSGNEHRSTASIGIAPFRHGHDSVGELLKQADIAMYQAKGGGRNTLRFFDPGLQAAMTERAALEADLRQALAQQEFELHYQPQVGAEGELLGAEALVRWRSPRRGLVPPGLFVPAAEETGLILPLGHWVLREACGVLAAWAEKPETAGLNMSVNVSAREFHHPDFAAEVHAVLEQTGANPARLKLELTESLLVEDLDAVAARMAGLKALGVGFALDDFGTGYSSLAYLQQLPLDLLKIDQSFVRQVLGDGSDAPIARTIIALGHSLGLDVMAEGVETAEQHAFLARHGCRAYQGYLFARPLPLPQLEAYIVLELAGRTARLGTGARGSG